MNGNAGRCFALGDPVMRVTMEYCAYTESIYRFFQPAGTEKSVDLRIFTLQRGANGGVVQDHDAPLGLQLDQCLLEANGVAD